MGGSGLNPETHHIKHVMNTVPDAPWLSVQHIKTVLASLSSQTSLTTGMDSFLNERSRVIKIIGVNVYDNRPYINKCIN